MGNVFFVCSYFTDELLMTVYREAVQLSWLI